ncbi:unnamed protein product [Arabidopsis thaliana]|uniref:Uncharacterized protein n=1 Tax=Arabidopsis thaliana TaxID=3702 RepID=A0A654FCB5_ARATH|nr:unnamed protein product [Arabidopsis thaliana]VYS59179.1 unnamed protein product [Arabidopsis thaliana]
MDTLVYLEKEPTPETLALALQEAAVWKKATLKEDDPTCPIPFVGSSQTPSTLLPECQLDASWHVDDTLSGHGWVLVRQDLVIHLGFKSSRRIYHRFMRSLTICYGQWSA